MIFIALGTQKFQMNRLLNEIDRLMDLGIINDEVIIQTGYSTTYPEKARCIKMMNKNDYQECIKNCDILITHGGVGTLLNGLKHGKKIIAVPRQSVYNEHVDDHQFEIVDWLTKNNYIASCKEISDLANLLNKIKKIKLNKFEIESNDAIFEFIDNYIVENL